MTRRRNPSNISRLSCLATTLAMPPAAALAAGEAGPDGDASVAAEIDGLRREIAELRREMGEAGSSWLTEARAAQVRSLVQEVLADADSRASLQSSGATAGWDKGFFLASADGNFKLKISGYAQIRWNYNYVDDPLPGQDRNAKGFENRRTYLTFEGHIIDPTWIYKIQGNFRSSDGTFVLQDAYARKELGQGFYVQGGQAKAPYMRETLASDTGLLTVDRSVIETVFGAGRTQGVFLGWSNDMFRVVGTFCDGSQAAGGLNSPWQQPTTEYAFIARGDIKLGEAEWSQYHDMTSFPGEKVSALIGAAILWQRGDAGSPLAGVETLAWTADAEIDFGGANLFGAVVGRHLDSSSPGGVNADQYGAYGQGGFFVAPQVELFGRYEWGDSDTGGEDFSAVTAGANWYIAKQQLKLSGDVGYGFNGVSAFFGGPGTAQGWRPDASGDGGQIVVRAQFQLMF